MTAAAQNELVGKYCTTCHCARGKAGGLSLAGFDADEVTENGELTEKIIRKLRARMMPPSGAPRPDDATVMAMVHTLERRDGRRGRREPASRLASVPATESRRVRRRR